VKPAIVVLFVDALGWRLAGSRPGFAASLEHRREIATVLGFSSGALPTAFSGRPPREHGRWLMYRRAGEGPTPFSGFERLAWLPPRLRRSWRLGQWLTRLVERRGVRGYFNLYDVPRDELAAFDLAEKDDLFAPGGLPVDTLWDSLQRRGARWRGWNWRTHEDESLRAVLARLEHGEEDFLFVYTADLDALLHREGTSGAGVRSRLARYDAWIHDAFAAAGRAGRPLWLYVCSDHGMVDVTLHVDVMSRLSGLAVRRGRDYVAFFDSTMARFWWRTPAAREAVRAALAAESRGRWLTDAELAAEGADFPGHDYGDDVFLLAPGVLMVPSFMGARPVAAMHGYDADHPDMTAFLASNRPLPGSVRRLADLRGLFEDALDAQAAESA
jgi:predicted transcriptional regulator